MSKFGSDPEIKAESVWAGPVLRPAAVLADRGPSGAVRIRTADGDWDRPPYYLKPFDSMLSEVADPQRAPELLVLREQIRSWRFYDHLRTDERAPARTAQVGTRTPVLESRRRGPGRRAADDPRDRHRRRHGRGGQQRLSR